MKIKIAITMLLALLMLGSCDSVDNKAVPSFTVRIDLSSYALWNTYGVTGVGDWTIFSRDRQLPSNFPYNVNTYTGFGGVLLMMALDTGTTGYAPVAYDAACPVESNINNTVTVDASNFEAYCPTCGSRYNVLTGSGGPVSGQAATRKLGLRTYKVRAATGGGYIITSY